MQQSGSFTVDQSRLAREESGEWIVKGKKEERGEARESKTAHEYDGGWILVGLPLFLCHNHRVFLSLTAAVFTLPCTRAG